eukprot:EG_transcript_8153
MDDLGPPAPVATQGAPTGNASQPGSPRPPPGAALAAALLAALSGLQAALAGLCLAFGPAWASVLPFVALGVNAAAAGHLWRTRDPRLALSAACAALAASALAVQWAAGDAGAATLNWALAAPALLLLAAGKDRWVRRGSAGLLVVVAAVTAVFYLYHGLTSRPPSQAPQSFAIPTATPPFQCVNLVLPALLNYLVGLTAVRRRHAAPALPAHLKQVELLAQRLLQWDLDGALVAVEPDPAWLLAALRHLAGGLPACRPRLPSRLLNRRRTVSFGPKPPSQTSFASSMKALVGQARASETSSMTIAAEPLAGAPASPPPALEYRTGTVLCARLPTLASYAVDDPRPERLREVAALVDLFCEVVEGTVGNTVGALYEVCHDGCLASWNCTVPPCRDHADAACQAAVALRDAWAARLEQRRLPPLPLAIGLWSGLLAAGGDTGLIGPGLAHAARLQEYSHHTGRAVVASATVGHHMSLVPKCKLLAVDVFCSDPEAPTLGGAEPPEDSELVYEVVGRLDVAEDEWMYQLQVVEDGGAAHKELERLWLQARRGVQDVPQFRRDLTALALTGDP